MGKWFAPAFLLHLALLVVPAASFADVLFETPLGNTTLGGLSAGSPRVFTQQAVFPASDFTCDTLPSWTIDEIDFRLGKNGIGTGEYQAALWFSNATGTPDIVSTNLITIGGFSPVATRTATFANVNIRDACHTYSQGGTSRGGRAPHLMFWGVRGVFGTGHEQGLATANHLGALAPATYVANPSFIADNWTFAAQVRGNLVPECTENCFSNVLFLPGIKATELYEGESKRWLPGLFNSDGERLAMDEGGESVNDIKVGEPINAVTFASVKILEIYADFLGTMENLKTEGLINDWQSAPYDWRYDVHDVVTRDQLMHDGSTRRLVEQIHTLAETSKTGKVTLIAHSNGGLVGKALIDALGEDVALIDRLIMVGTPQLGTPSAIPAMLHGIDQGLPVDAAPFAMSSATARALSEYMPGVYGLLPIGTYLNTVADPVIEFEVAPATGAYRAAYGEAIETRDELFSFLKGTGDGRAEPGENDTLAPTILNEGMLMSAATSRVSLESWAPPSGIEVVQIVGWGLDTVRGLRYRERSCPLFSGCTFLDVEPLLAVEGDGTVMAPSASALGSAYYFNMSAFNAQNQTAWSHANILAASAVQDLLRDIITETDRAAAHITVTQPETTAMDKRLRLAVHSPVTIGVHDAAGRFTGMKPNPDSASDIPVVIHEIPNSYYRAFGEGKYAGFRVGDEHEILLSGTGSGTFTLEIEEVVGDEVVDIATYSDIPVATTTVATLTITDIANKSALAIDEDGDGSTDNLANPDGEAPPIIEMIALIGEKINALSVEEHTKKMLLKKLAKFEEKTLRKGVTPQVVGAIKTLLKHLAQVARKENISEDDVRSISRLIEQLDDL